MLVLRVSSDDPDPAAIGRAADALRDGGIVAYPTDTLYGLAVDPRRDDAVSRLIDVKGRDASMGITLIAASLEQAREAGLFGADELRLARAFWPGPLTIVLPARDRLSRRLVGSGSTVAVRVPAHPVAQSLAERFAFCITATSANVSGHPPAARPEEATAALGASIDVVLDAGPTAGGAPSTIVEVTASGLKLVRAGAIAWDRVLRSVE
jgi:L-threonylcarbamoyladenylate synthase